MARKPMPDGGTRSHADAVRQIQYLRERLEEAEKDRDFWREGQNGYQRRAEAALAEYRERLAAELDARAETFDRFRRRPKNEVSFLDATEYQIREAEANAFREAAALVRERGADG